MSRAPGSRLLDARLGSCWEIESGHAWPSPSLRYSGKGSSRIVAIGFARTGTISNWKGYGPGNCGAGGRVDPSCRRESACRGERMARTLGVADVLADCPCSCDFRVSASKHGLCRSRVRVQGPGKWRRGQVQALIMEPSDSTSDNVGDFAKRMEQAWLISKQPRPVQCVSCEASGVADCPWCKGTGFFILGDNMLCEVPSRNTSCRVCFGQGTLPCDDCKGTGYRAKWLAQLPKKLKDML